MSLNTWVECLISQNVAGTLQNTYTTAKSVIDPTALYTFPPNYFQIGKTLRIRASGGISNVVTAQPTFTFQVNMGTIAVHTSQAVLTTTTVHTTIPFIYEVVLTCRAIGSGTAANFMGQARGEGIMFVISGAVGDPTSGVGVILCPNTAPAVGTGFNSTISNILDFFVGISVSNAGNGIQIQQYTVEAMN